MRTIFYGRSCGNCKHFRPIQPKDRPELAYKDAKHWCDKLGMATQYFRLRCGGDDYEVKPGKNIQK